MALVGEARGQRDLRDRGIGLHQEPRCLSGAELAQVRGRRGVEVTAKRADQARALDPDGPRQRGYRGRPLRFLVQRVPDLEEPPRRAAIACSARAQGHREQLQREPLASKLRVRIGMLHLQGCPPRPVGAAAGRTLRMVFHEIRPDHISWRWERAEAGGATWTPLLLIEYRRSGTARK